MCYFHDVIQDLCMRETKRDNFMFKFILTKNGHNDTTLSVNKRRPLLVSFRWKHIRPYLIRRLDVFVNENNNMLVDNKSKPCALEEVIHWFSSNYYESYTFLMTLMILLYQMSLICSPIWGVLSAYLIIRVLFQNQSISSGSLIYLGSI